jgi:FkbM family methyltransferase
MLGSRRAREQLRTTLQAANHRLGSVAGFAFARYPTRLNAELRLLLRGFSIDHVLDVGAHQGGFGRKLRKYTGFGGDISSFEPTPASYTTLVSAAEADGRWRVFNMALGSTQGSVQLNTYIGDGQMNSIRSIGSDLSPSGPPVVVDLKRLDKVWPDLHQDPATTLLKTDTQGYDLEVLQGAGELMERIPATLMEVAVQPLYDGAPTLRTVAAFMDDLGFEMTAAFPIHRYQPAPGIASTRWDPHGLRVIEFDCTFVNQRYF